VAAAPRARCLSIRAVPGGFWPRRRRANLLSLARSHDELLETPEVEVAVCLLPDLIQQGPFAPIFRTIAEPRTSSDWLGAISDGQA
jgi:hypothetical protein